MATETVPEWLERIGLGKYSDGITKAGFTDVKVSRAANGVHGRTCGPADVGARCTVPDAPLPVFPRLPSTSHAHMCMHAASSALVPLVCVAAPPPLAPHHARVHGTRR